MKELEPRIRDIVVDLLDKVAERGSCDAVRDVAIPLTIRVIVEQLGLGRHRAWRACQQASAGPVMYEDSEQAPLVLFPGYDASRGSHFQDL